MSIAVGTRVKVREDVQPLFPEDHVQDWAGKEGKVVQPLGFESPEQIQVRLDMHADVTLSLYENELAVL